MHAGTIKVFLSATRSLNSLLVAISVQFAAGAFDPPSPLFPIVSLIMTEMYRVGLPITGIALSLLIAYRQLRCE